MAASTGGSGTFCAPTPDFFTYFLHFLERFLLDLCFLFQVEVEVSGVVPGVGASRFTFPPGVAWLRKLAPLSLPADDGLETGVSTGTAGDWLNGCNDMRESGDDFWERDNDVGNADKGSDETAAGSAFAVEPVSL